MTSPRRVLIGGVGYRWMRDASFGVVASDALAAQDWPPGVEVSDLGYGALYITQDLRDAQPPYDRLILLAGVERGRAPGELYRQALDGWADGPPGDVDEVQARVREVGAGIIDLDHLLVIARYFRALPSEVVLLEVEPVESTPGADLSPKVAALLPAALARARAEALAPLIEREPVG